MIIKTFISKLKIPRNYSADDGDDDEFSYFTNAVLKRFTDSYQRWYINDAFTELLFEK